MSFNSNSSPRRGRPAGPAGPVPVEGIVQLKRACGHSSPYTFKKNERFARQRLEAFLAKKCPDCTVAAIKELEAKQKEESQRLRKQKKKKKPENKPDTSLNG